MRVLMLNERDLRHPLAGGVEVHLEEIASRLASAHGIEMTVLCAGYPGGVGEVERRGIRYVRFGNRFTYYAQLPWRARRELAARRYDLVIENQCKLLFFSGLYLRGVPKLALVHHLFGLSAFRQVAPPIATFVVATEVLLPVLYRGWPFVVVSPSTRDDLRARGIPEGDIRIIPNAVDHETFRPGPAPPERDLVVFIGRIEHYKGVDWLLDAWPAVRAAHPSARLVIVGAGSAEGAMRRRCRGPAFRDSVSFAGFVPDAEKVEWMRRATLVVQPSRKEGWGLTVLEASACGTPVVATDVPGLRDSVRHGATGFLVRPGDPSALASAIGRLVADPDLRERLSRGAREWASRFTWEASAAAFASALREAAAGRRLPEMPDWLATDGNVSAERSSIADPGERRQASGRS